MASSDSSSICLRIKRENQTFFISTTKSKSIRSIKEEISKALNQEIPAEKMRLYLPNDTNDTNTKLPDEAIVSDHNERIQNDSILYVVFRKKGMEDAAGEDEFGELDNVWEDVNIVQAQEDS